MTVLLAVMYSSVAQADDSTLLLGGRAVAEVWQDPNLATVYRSASLGVEGGFSWRPHSWLSLDGDAGVIRMTGEEEQAIELIPMSLGVYARSQREESELFFGVGAALVPFSDQGNAVITGSKLGLDVQMGVRLATDLINPSLSSTSPVQRADWEITVGRRQHMTGEIPGLDLSAWRIGVGLVVRL